MLDQPGVRTLIAYLRAAADPSSDELVTAIVNEPKRGVGPALLAQLRTAARTSRQTLFESIRR
jgi:superfamily I DNA/RNA helicase